MPQRISSMRSKKISHMDLTIITWLAIKLVIDTGAFIYIIWRLRHLS